MISYGNTRRWRDPASNPDAGSVDNAQQQSQWWDSYGLYLEQCHLSLAVV
jgi:hypothetical protein